MQYHRKTWRPVVSVCLVVLVSACTTPPANDLHSSRSRDGDAPAIIADAKSKCRFQIVEPGYLELQQGSWVRPAWDGACVDGWAEGPGVERLGWLPSKSSGLDERRQLGLIDPPWFVAHGTLHHGLAEGGVLIETPFNVNILAWYQHGIRSKTQAALVQYVDGFGPWETYPDQANKGRDVASFAPFPRFASELLGQAPHQRFSRDFTLLDFNAYPNPAAMRTAIAKAYPLLSNATDFLELLRIAAFHRATTILSADMPDVSCRQAPNALLGALLAESYTICTATRRINAGHDNTDRWVAQFIFARNNLLIGMAVDRFFDGSDFLARKTMLRAEDFVDPNSFAQAALQTLGGQVTRQAVTALMTNAGLVLSAGAGPGRMPPRGDEQAMNLAFLRRSLADAQAKALAVSNQGIAMLESGCRVEFGLVWEFARADGRFLKVEPVHAGACL